LRGRDSQGEFALGALSEGFFAEADTNGDGVVSKQEFVAWHVQASGGAPTEDDWRLFNAAAGSGRPTMF
jgi:hypothetical protein